MSPTGSIDNLQKELAESVFKDRVDKKKASGRALGTLLEMISFYLLREWGMNKTICIERRIPEYKQPDITHNVEFSLHPIKNEFFVNTQMENWPISATKLIRALKDTVPSSVNENKTTNQLLSSRGVLRNCAVISETTNTLYVAHPNISNKHSIEEASVVLLDKDPYAIIECKRVGVEEGQTKGPTTIEKAKQGAYVARTVSRLQRVTDANGKKLGYLPTDSGNGELRPYMDWVDELAQPANPIPKGVVLTIGIVSNHGNWYTHSSMNKELKVLSGSYDWLLFLSDECLSKFVKETIMEPAEEYKDIQDSFLQSYDRNNKNSNSFTKVKIDIAAAHAVEKYFSKNISEIEKQINVVSPPSRKLSDLKQTLKALALKTESS